MLNRVVVSGIGGISAFGRDWASIQTAFKQGRNAVQNMGWQGQYPDLEAQLGAPIEGYAPPAHWTRKQLRSMGRVSYLCVDAAEQALEVGMMRPVRPKKMPTLAAVVCGIMRT